MQKYFWMKIAGTRQAQTVAMTGMHLAFLSKSSSMVYLFMRKQNWHYFAESSGLSTACLSAVKCLVPLIPSFILKHPGTVHLITSSRPWSFSGPPQQKRRDVQHLIQCECLYTCGEQRPYHKCAWLLPVQVNKVCSIKHQWYAVSST